MMNITELIESLTAVKDNLESLGRDESDYKFVIMNKQDKGNYLGKSLYIYRKEHCRLPYDLPEDYYEIKIIDTGEE